MKTIWKYELQSAPGLFLLHLPPDFKPVHFDKQGGVAYMWAEVDTEAQGILHNFYCYGTGHDVPHEHEYMGTISLGGFVWHYYR
jgi:hypothetical protein